MNTKGPLFSALLHDFNVLGFEVKALVHLGQQFEPTPQKKTGLNPRIQI